MSSTQDTEITLGTGKLLVLFFSLVGVCALFFALGYSLGRKSEPSLASVNPAPQPAPVSTKAAGSTAAPPMTFYKNVEQKDANPELTPATETKTDTANGTAPANPTTAQRSRSDHRTAVPRILRPGRRRQQAGRCRRTGRRIKEETIPGLRGRRQRHRQALPRAMRPLLRHQRSRVAPHPPGSRRLHPHP